MPRRGRARESTDAVRSRAAGADERWTPPCTLCRTSIDGPCRRFSGTIRPRPVSSASAAADRAARRLAAPARAEGGRPCGSGSAGAMAGLPRATRATRRTRHVAAAVIECCGSSALMPCTPRSHAENTVGRTRHELQVGQPHRSAVIRRLGDLQRRGSDGGCLGHRHR